MNTAAIDDRLYNRSFALALASQTCFVLANTLMAHYARWVEFLGGDVGQVGWVMGAGAIVGLVLRPWLGQWINRLGARNTWAMGYAIFAVGSLGNLAVEDFGWLLYVWRSSLVLGAAFVFASSLTFITQTSPESRRTEAIGVLGAGGFFGMLIGPLLGDLILGSGERVRGDFVVLFVSAAGSLVLPLILLWFVHIPPASGHVRRVKLIDFIRTARQNWPGMILLVNVVFGICMTVPFGFLASYVDHEHLQLPGVSVIGMFFFGYAGWGVTVRLSLRRVPERWGRRKVLLVGMIFMAAGMFCFPLVHADHVKMILIPALLCGTGHALIFHTMTSLTLHSFPHSVRGSGSALSLMALDLGMIGGAPILGQIADAAGFAWMFVAIGVSCVAIAIVYAISSIPVWMSRQGT